ncbi:Uncharacterised protein [Morganella morganii]|uniref:hypothetical protein n=1 Tax=Morganella morganii TaxID=582 RepID=UPI000786ED79|nr:hypothetical protein [Morganella morganii]MBS9586029.1 hypothetical protein [Morganella morganii subsp. morganii]QWL86871.1 hypothetical protein IR216_05690 [Morganella morganii subsp. morganii]WQD68570.1 hypothetical protein U0006_05100 [Morganella morganii]VDY33455.1 Uncharacterised protein [Morganella morganii]HDS3825835.1 hypothetical protein [Morganella morganii subsp. morganii]
MSVDYLVFGGDMHGDILTKEKYMKKIPIFKKVISSNNKSPQNIGYSLDVIPVFYKGSTYAIVANSNFDTDEAGAAIDEYKPRPIPAEFL